MENKVVELFKNLDIPYDLVYHQALFSAKDRVDEVIDFKGAICCKNLLLTEAKTNRLFLYSLSIEKRADLKNISEKLSLNRLSFAKEDALEENLGIKKGNASILNIIQKPDTNVVFLVDKELLKVDKVAFHPNINTMSIIFESKYISKILENYKANYMYIDA